MAARVADQHERDGAGERDGTQAPFELDAVIPFLLTNRLIATNDVVSGNVSVESEPRRNRNFRVRTASGGYFLKHPERLSPGSFVSTAREAFFLGQAASLGVDGVVPHLVMRDDAACVTVLELLPAHTTLWAHFGSFEHLQFPIGICADVGRALAEIHTRLTDSFGRESDFVRSLNASPPWAAQIHRPPLWLLGSLTPGAEEVLRIVQGSDSMSAGLDAVGHLWAANCVVHGDIKADNILIDVRDGRCIDLRMVDWEMVQRGDPAWDAAGFVQELIVTWLRQFARIDSDALDTAIAQAKLPLAIIQRAIQRFWWTYAEHAHISKEDRGAFSARLAHYVGVRMIQTIYEATMKSSTISAPLVLALQVSENILTDPVDAARSLLGLDVHDEH